MRTLTYIPTFLFVLLFFSLQAQNPDEGIIYKDHTYLSHVRTVTFHPINNPVGYPVLTLNTRSELNIDTLVLGFDDLSGSINSYIYTVELCNKNWEPVDLPSVRYIDGYENENIDTYEPSAATITPFIHFELQIPNENLTLKLAGNYLLKVYEDEDYKRLAFTKRFLVVKPTYNILGKIVPTFDAKKRNTHHEIDFYVDHKGQTLLNAKATFSATIMQNNRWDTAIENIQPIFLRDEKLIFDYNDKLVFDALRDFRQLDNRSFNDRSFEVQKIERFEDGYFVQNKPEEKRTFTFYAHRPTDINGSFFIQNLDGFPEIDSPEYNFRQAYDLPLLLAKDFYFLDPAHTLEGDYSINQFKLNYPKEIENAEVFIYGGFTNYELSDEYRMKYNPDKSRYEANCLLKQGFYEYLYAVVRDQKVVDFQVMESNLFETENEYTILIYHTPFGSQYDQLVAVYRVTSVIQE